MRHRLHRAESLQSLGLLPVRVLTSPHRSFTRSLHQPSTAHSARLRSRVNLNGAAAARGGLAAGEANSQTSGSTAASVQEDGRSSVNGFTARAWNSIPHWCTLCCEPVNVWNDHRGKREHICLEMFYNALVHAERRWDPVDLWREVDDDSDATGFCLSGGRCTGTSRFRGGGGNKQRAKRAGEASQGQPPMISAVGERMDTSARSRHFSPGGDFYANPISSFQRAFDVADPQHHRQELFFLLKFLTEKRVLLLTPNNVHHCSFEGSLVLFKELFQPLSGMFPFADAKEVSALTQMVSATFNSETVFDLCQLQRLVPEELLRSRGVLLSGANTTTGNAEDESMTTDGEASVESLLTGEADVGAAFSGGDSLESKQPPQQQQRRGLLPAFPSRSSCVGVPSLTHRSGGTAEESLPFFFKGVFCRAVLGALRWSLEPDSLLPPPALQPHLRQAQRPSPPRERPAVAVTARCEAYAVLAARACRLLITEHIHSKVREYVVRVEGVFREPHLGLAEAEPYRFANCSAYNPLLSISVAAAAAADEGKGEKKTGGHALYTTLGAPRRRAVKTKCRAGTATATASSATCPVPPPSATAAAAAEEMKKRPQQRQPVWHRLLQSADVKSDANPLVFRAKGLAYLRGRPEVVPPAFEWGMLQYCENGRFFDNDFKPYATRGALPLRQDHNSSHRRGDSEGR